MVNTLENLALVVEYEELLRYCPMLEVDPKTVQELDRHTLQVLSNTARSNLARQRELQRQGIAQAKAQGVRFGRPKAKAPKNFAGIVQAWQEGQISRTEALQQSGQSESTFYRYLKKLREQG